MTDFSFIFNRYVKGQRLVEGYRYCFEPFGGGAVNEPFWKETILSKGELFLDIGANVGGWSIPASSYYEKIIAFEPSHIPRITLRKNLALNRVTNVSINETALGEAEFQTDLYHYPKNGQDSLLKNHTGLSTDGEVIRVRVKPLDSFNLKPTIVKIDVEGYEIEVLRGAKKTILESSPILCIETHEPYNVDRVQRMLDYTWNMFERRTENGPQTMMIGKPKVLTKEMDAESLFT